MENPRHWRLNKQRYAMVGELCSHCGAKLFPPREICPHCGGGAHQQVVEDEKAVFAFPVASSSAIHKG